MATARTEVLPGSGLAIRRGGVVAWLAPAASHQLVSYVVNVTEEVATDPQPGHRVTGPIEDVLRNGDPEPATAFAVLADASGGREAVLHGSVQLWDGTRWVLPQPPYGWMHWTVPAGTPVLMMAAGSPPPTVHPDSPLDLREGVVIGAGVILVPGDEATSAAAYAGASGLSQPAPSEPAFSPSSPSEYAPFTPVTGEPRREGDHPSPVEQPSPVGGAFTSAERSEEQGAEQPSPFAPGGEEAPPAEGAPPAEAAVPPEAVSPGEETSPVEGASPAGATPPTGGASPAEASSPAESSPAAESSPTAEAETVAGAGPSPGALLAEDGSSYRLDCNYVVGSEPDGDDAVRWGGARSLRLAAPGDRVAPVHAEIRVVEGRVQVVDRGSGAGSFVLMQGAQQWSPLTPGEPHDLAPDTHLAFGQRVFLFVSHVPH
jgi:hypothetical protein